MIPDFLYMYVLTSHVYLCDDTKKVIVHTHVLYAPHHFGAAAVCIRTRVIQWCVTKKYALLLTSVILWACMQHRHEIRENKRQESTPA